jgi:hypothetical protein
MVTTVRFGGTGVEPVEVSGEQFDQAVRSLTGDELYEPPDDRSFEAELADYLPAEDLTEMAEALLDRTELRFGDLRELEIVYLWRRNGGKSQGMPVLGKPQKPSGLLAYFSHADFVIWLAADHCRAYEFTRAQVEAALAHELMHIGQDEDGKPCIVGHDFEGFRREIEVLGLWRHDLQRAGDAF